MGETKGASMAIEYDISIRASWEELRQLSPEQCAAFMQGCAEVLSANPYSEIVVDPPEDD